MTLSLYPAQPACLRVGSACASCVTIVPGQSQAVKGGILCNGLNKITQATLLRREGGPPRPIYTLWKRLRGQYVGVISTAWISFQRRYIC